MRILKCVEHGLPGLLPVKYYLRYQSKVYQLSGTIATGWTFGKVNDNYLTELIVHHLADALADEVTSITWLEILVVTGKTEEDLIQFDEDYYR